METTSFGTPVHQIGNFALYERLENPPIEWLLEDVIKDAGITMLYGASGCMKSYSSVDLACRIVNGMDFHGKKLKQGNVIYVAAEAADETNERIDAWLAYHNKTERPLILPEAIDLHDRSHMEVLREFVDRVGNVRLVVVDGLSDCASQVRLSDPDHVNMMLKPHLLAFTRTSKVGLFILHHEGHTQGRERGAKVLRDMVDTAIHAKKNDNMFDITWELRKVRRQNPDKMQPIHLHIEDVSETVGMDNMAVIQGGFWPHGNVKDEPTTSVTTSRLSTEDRVIDYLEQMYPDTLEADVSEIEDALDIKSDTLRQTVYRSKRLHKPENGLVALCDM